MGLAHEAQKYHAEGGSDLHPLQLFGHCAKATPISQYLGYIESGFTF